MKLRPLAGLLVLVVGALLLWWRLSQLPPPSPVVPDAAPSPQGAAIPKPLLAPVLGQTCAVTGTVLGGPIERAVVQSRRALVDVDAEVAPDGASFRAQLPEQGPLWIVAIAADGRTATQLAECGGEGTLAVVLNLPPPDPHAGTLRGRCLYLETGAPVPNAVVRAGVDGPGDTLVGVRSAISGSDGRFSLALPPGTWRALCAKDADEGLPREVELDAGLGSEVELYVEGRAGVAGVVLEVGQPVAGAAVRASVARTFGTPLTVTGETDAEGRFLLSGLPAGPVRVEAQAGKSFAEGQVIAQVALPYAELRLELGAAQQRIEGLVLGPDQAPVEQARITARGLERGLELERSAASGPGGDFVIAGLVPGRYRLSARADGFRDAEQEVLVNGPANVELRLELACPVEVKILPAAPVTPVRLNVKPEKGPRKELAGFTGEPLTITGLTGVVELTARSVGSTVRTATRSVELCGTKTLELSLEDRAGTGAVWVTVRDQEQKPVPNAEVWRAGAGRFRTDNEGQARFEGLAPGKHLIGAADARPVEVQVNAGETTTLELRVERGRGEIRGQVVAGGGPVEGARILANCADTGRPGGLEEAGVLARSDEQGNFSFQPETGSACRVRAEHPTKGRSRAVLLRAGGDPGRLELLGSASISGRVVDAEERTPIAPCSVGLASLGGAAEVEGRTIYVGQEDGRFRIDDVAPGRVALSVVGEKGRGRIELELQPNQHQEGVELLVFSRGRVLGRVLDSERRPVPDAQISVRAGGRVQARAVTSGDGRFDLEADAGEPLQAYASKKGYYPRGTSPFDLLPGPPTDIGDLILERRGAPEEKEGGIGVVFSAEDHGIRVIRFIEDSPAREAGLLVGDLITAINGTPFGREPMVNWVVQLRGRAGTPVRLEIERGTDPPFEVNVTRRAVGLPPMPEDAD